MTVNSQQTAIAVFGYKRADHLHRCLVALQNISAASHLPIFIFLDGPKTEAERTLTESVVQIARNFQLSRKCEISVSKVNRGLSTSLISGVTQVLSKFESIIVLEDDILCTPGFIEFCVNGLKVFREKDNVASIHGYCPPLSVPPLKPFFLKGADCWGWATWKDRWADFDQDANSLVRKLDLLGHKTVREFNFDGAYDFYSMLKQQRDGEIDSWAVRWHASNFLDSKLTLYPPVSLVENIGLDGSGTHFKISDHSHQVKPQNRSYDLSGLEITESLVDRMLFVKFYSSLKHSLVRRLSARIKLLFQGLH